MCESDEQDPGLPGRLTNLTCQGAKGRPAYKTAPAPLRWRRKSEKRERSLRGLVGLLGRRSQKVRCLSFSDRFIVRRDLPDIVTPYYHHHHHHLPPSSSFLLLPFLPPTPYHIPPPFPPPPSTPPPPPQAPITFLCCNVAPIPDPLQSVRAAHETS